MTTKKTKNTYQITVKLHSGERKADGTHFSETNEKKKNVEKTVPGKTASIQQYAVPFHHGGRKAGNTS